MMQNLPFMKHSLKMDLFGDTRIATAPSNLAPRDHRTEAGNGELRSNQATSAVCGNAIVGDGCLDLSLALVMAADAAMLAVVTRRTVVRAASMRGCLQFRADYFNRSG